MPLDNGQPAGAPEGPLGPQTPPVAVAAPVSEGAQALLGARYHFLALGFALAGGVLGVLGAVFEELRAGGFAFLAAGVIEEALKPSGVYIVLVKWPRALRGRLYTASMTALSGLVFGVIEALVYVLVYFPDKGGDFVLYRFTVPLAVHSACSFVFGLGIKRELVDWANGVAPFPKDSRNLMAAAMVLHGGFNLVALALQLSRVVDFG
jgi:RsiW-degrading membrane proteinase PrsW (M82 family)